MLIKMSHLLSFSVQHKNWASVNAFINNKSWGGGGGGVKETIYRVLT